MSPQISEFPNEQFYDGQMKDHSQALLDNPNRTREKMHLLSQKLKVDPSGRKYFEYIVVDVKRGASRLEVNGHSLVNHANSDKIVALLKEMIALGIKPEEIKILCYYQGQRRLLRNKINTAEDMSDEDKAALRIHTVDSFHGQESSVVIVDMVAARDPLMFTTGKGKKPMKQDPTVDDEMDNGSESYLKLGAITGHVRSANRLNVALTRAMHGLVVVCQEALLVGNPKFRKNRGNAYNAIGNMCTNARERGCLVSDDITEDTHPQSIALREKLSERQIQEIRRVQDAEDLGHIAELKKVSMEPKKQSANAEPVMVPSYRTAKGHTTRPFMVSRAAIEADKYDREQSHATQPIVVSRPVFEAEKHDQGQERLIKGRSLARMKEEEEFGLAKALSESQKDKEFPPLLGRQNQG